MMDLAGPGLAQVDQVEGETGQRASSLVKWKGVADGAMSAPRATDRVDAPATPRRANSWQVASTRRCRVSALRRLRRRGGAAMAMIEFGRTDEAVSLDRVD